MGTQTLKRSNGLPPQRLKSIAPISLATLRSSAPEDPSPYARKSKMRTNPTPSVNTRQAPFHSRPPPALQTTPSISIVPMQPPCKCFTALDLQSRLQLLQTEKSMAHSIAAPIYNVFTVSARRLWKQWVPAVQRKTLPQPKARPRTTRPHSNLSNWAILGDERRIHGRKINHDRR